MCEESFIYMLLTRKCNENPRKLHELNRIFEQDEATNKRQAELGVSNHVIPVAALQLRSNDNTREHPPTRKAGESMNVIQLKLASFPKQKQLILEVSGNNSERISHKEPMWHENHVNIENINKTFVNTTLISKPTGYSATNCTIY